MSCAKVTNAGEGYYSSNNIKLNSYLQTLSEEYTMTYEKARNDYQNGNQPNPLDNYKDSAIQYSLYQFLNV